MRWRKGVQSAHVEDRRGSPRRRRGAQFGMGTIIVLLVGAFVGGDAAQLLQGLLGAGGGQQGHTQSEPLDPANDSERETVEFINFVHEDVKGAWDRILGPDYVHPKLVLFREGTNTGCGFSKSDIGPFYCPADQTAYIDLSFYRDLKQRFKAPGDFAQAYVLAHEVGHHVQHLLGTSTAVRKAQARNPSMKNELSVRLELQADCYAGLWAHSTKQRELLERGDLEEALGAASAIGDDRLQKQAGRAVQAETWTHGSSAQRMRWFSRGMETGSIDACNTLAAERI